MTAGDGDTRKATAAALGRVPSGMFILTARHGPDETGMLGSWVQQCSFEPLMLSVAVRRDRYVAGWLTPDAPFTLNVLDEDQTDLVAHFGRGFGRGEPAFQGLDLLRDGDAPPALADALAYLHCVVAGRHPAGDHDLFLGRVVGGRVLAEGRPMVHVRKSAAHY